MLSYLRCPAAVLVCVFGLASTAPAQPPGPPNDRAAVDARIDAALREQWSTVLADVAVRAGQTVQGGRPSGTAQEREGVYRQVLELMASRPLERDLERLVTRAYVQSLVDEQVESRMAVSANAASTNPATAGLVERSGSTSLAALAADLSSVVSADKTAISLNISALAFLSMKDPELYSALANYQRHDFARRFSGTIVTGSRVPEHEITGISNLPDFAKIVDAVSWDVKARVLGDKDPRSARWSPLTLVRTGLLVQKAALIVSLAPTVEDAAILARLLNARVGVQVAQIRARMARSPQLSVKFAGTHLTKEPGMNKYSAAAMFDAGLGTTDVTANVQYAAANDISLGIDQLFTAKAWTLAGSITAHLAPGSIVAGRTIDWSSGVTRVMFQDREGLPLPVENTWKVFSKFEFPIRGGGRIPVSVIYSNDPNALSKERFVSGLVGVSYDFSALKQLFAPGS